MHTRIIAAIEFSFVQTSATGNEALDGPTTVDILLPIVVNIVPDTTILQNDIVVSVAITGGTAQSKLHGIDYT